MKNFKKYLSHFGYNTDGHFLIENYNISINENYRDIIELITSDFIPFDARRLEKILNTGNRKKYYFRTVESKKLNKCVNTKRKIQVSAFDKYEKTLFGDIDIFRGPLGLEKKIPAICVMYGKYTYKFNTDVFSYKDDTGRLWLEPMRFYQQHNDGVIRFEKIRKEIYNKFNNFLQKLPGFKEEYGSLGLEYFTGIHGLDEYDTKILSKIINKFLMISDEVYKKHKSELVDIIPGTMKELNGGYNELFAYDFDVKEIIIFDFKNENLESKYKWFKLDTNITDKSYKKLFTDLEQFEKQGIKITFASSNDEIHSILEKYNKKNHNKS